MSARTTQAEALDRWRQTLTRAFDERAPPIDANVADAWGSMSSTRPVPVVDGLLAATAKVHDLTLVTRNEADVQGLGAKILNPFT